MPDVCRHCKRRVRHAIGPDAWIVALDYEPDDTGEWGLAAAPPTNGPPRAVFVAQERRATFTGSLYTAHQQTCPYAGKDRRRWPH